MQEHERREHSANWHRWPALSPRAMGNDTALKIVLWQRQRACEGAGASRATVNTDAESANEDAQSAESRANKRHQQADRENSLSSRQDTHSAKEWLTFDRQVERKRGI